MHQTQAQTYKTQNKNTHIETCTKINVHFKMSIKELFTK